MGLGLAGSLLAYQFVPLSIDELAQQAQLVVQGRVLKKSCHQDPQGRIYTQVELQVAEVWRGQVASDTLLIVHSGGTVGRKTVRISGQVEYLLNEEVVAFLVRNQRGEAVTLGLAQGKFHVWSDPATGVKLVHNPFHGGLAAGASQPQLEEAANRRDGASKQALRSEATGAAVVSKGGMGLNGLTLAELKKQVLKR